MQELPKPWFDLKSYKQIRLEEAKFEANLAQKFLEEGLVRNAAGKAFQAWKALIGAMLVDKREELIKKYPGRKKIKGGKAVEKADWLIAIVPTSYLEELSLLIGKDAAMITAIALQVHDYQYNGPDKEGVLSAFRSDEVATEHIRILIEEILRRADKSLATQV
ncbi:MAG: PaREP1 family protein [Candidatus Aramenus sp.]|nr:PaREP1 family protein [Candidatus Aramenus sp.]